ncbi:MAG TPA: RHS repeat-associated core domain-containing protein, partial [Gemmatimonadales bacterium]
ESCQGKPIDIYTYGADGKLRQHKKSYETPSGQRLTETRIYWYDALGRRILLHSPNTLANGALARDYGTWRYYYAGDQLITVSQSDPLRPDAELGPWTRFTPGLGPNEVLASIIDRASPNPDIQKFYVRDRLGSVRSVRDETGTTVATAGYSAYGEEKAGSPPIESGFAGGLGAGDLVQFRHRYYDPKTGQFLTEDPIGFAGGGNLYAYAANNPGHIRIRSGSRRVHQGIPASIL